MNAEQVLKRHQEILDRKAELEIMLKDSENKIEELETELSKYNKKRGKRKNE